ncbi:MAG: hypothetical protein J3K34DRAFT_443665 [Monoraphidium minutum]|nr:MAG: hypothetical protein J3K34DRAFT_443665 [Monoraphidium minutum]
MAAHTAAYWQRNPTGARFPPPKHMCCRLFAAASLIPLLVAALAPPLYVSKGRPLTNNQPPTPIFATVFSSQLTTPNPASSPLSLSQVAFGTLAAAATYTHLQVVMKCNRWPPHTKDQWRQRFSGRRLACCARP